jgi:hypothetical protein
LEITSSKCGHHRVEMPIRRTKTKRNKASNNPTKNQSNLKQNFFLFIFFISNVFEMVRVKIKIKVKKRDKIKVKEKQYE